MKTKLLLTLTPLLLSMLSPASEGQTLIGPWDGYPITISQPGSYKLAENLVVPDANTNAIVITANDVTLDLNGFSIIGPTVCTGAPVSSCSPTGTGVGVAATNGFQQNITVVNGNVHGMGLYGIQLFGTGHYVERVHADNNGSIGMLVGGTVIGCTANSNGQGGISSQFGTVSGNTAIRNGAVGITVFCPAAVVNSTAFNNTAGNLVFVGPGICAAANNAAP